MEKSRSLSNAHSLFQVGKGPAERARTQVSTEIEEENYPETRPIGSSGVSRAGFKIRIADNI